ncbi:type II secretion system protein [Marinobacter manganoxydans]|uniref:Type II secretory pathway, pseudopilin PulG n=1 Tax=Marinobacter manganoxydans MnI7-9 TaxID=1094979 RepID=G6YQ33_9GAMM|nr:type II secretion system protein [Marinobacter manganoxydans]EHJ05809.1 type II secretory pathway, pseudopilin PulG [Marinobacter manganoxydans MnI7-9]
MRINDAPMSSGFTLVELVTVIILIGVLSALGIGLFASRSAFSPLLATQQLASATLLAQQAALAGNPANTLTIERDSNVFRFVVGSGTGNERTFEVAHEGATLAVAGNTLPLTVTFNTKGAPSAGNNMQFSFSGESTFQTCLSSLGAVYAGSCQS